MNLIINYASIEDKEKMIGPYFGFYNALYGGEITTNAIYRRMAKGKKINPVLGLLSTNYQKALYSINDAIDNNQDLCLLEISDPDYMDNETGKPLVLAYARLSWKLPFSSATEFQREKQALEDEIQYETEEMYSDYSEDEEKPAVEPKNRRNAGVHDIAIAVAMSDELAQEFYSCFIDKLEEFVKERNEETEIITHEVPSNNAAYLDAIFENKEYSTMEKISYPRTHTIMFDKWVRNKPLTLIRKPKKANEK